MQAAEILTKYVIHRNKIRIAILELLIQSQQPLSGNEIREKLNVTCSRVTVFRTLQLFIEAGFVHLAYSDKTKFKYFFAMQLGKMSVHFTCTSCKRIFLLNVPPVTLPPPPAGYTYQRFVYLVTGVCSTCK